MELCEINLNVQNVGSMEKQKNTIRLYYGSDEGTYCLIREVVLNDAMFRCLKCNEFKPGIEFGLVLSPDGVVTNRDLCESCRSS